VSPEPGAELLAALLESLALKDLPRAGWVRRGVAAPEDVAAHSWGVAWLTLVLLPPELDRARALAYAVLHDLPEVRVGDLTPADGVAHAEKAAREARAMTGLTNSLPAHVLELWQAYEAQQDPEARFVRQIDRLDMALQAAVYRDRTGLDLDEFFASARGQITEPRLIALLDAARR
jgi:putative hydrolase of HD superfamily